MTEGEDLELVARVLPGNNSLTHFTDFRCSHDDLTALLAEARKEAYRNGWDDREADLLAGVARIVPASALDPQGEASLCEGKQGVASRSQPCGAGSQANHAGPDNLHSDGRRA